MDFLGDFSANIGHLWPLIGALVGGYFLGSIPFGLILVRAAGLGDVRARGSGNIGATNVLRVGTKPLAAATLLLDGGKGAAAVLIFSPWGWDAALFAAAGSVVGHILPPWLKFRGGKGLATALGLLLALNWQTGILAALTWLAVGWVSRYSSLAALAAMIAAPVYAWSLTDPGTTLLVIFVAALVIMRHHDNIRSLIDGTETKIGEDSDTKRDRRPSSSE